MVEVLNVWGKCKNGIEENQAKKKKEVSVLLTSRKNKEL